VPLLGAIGLIVAVPLLCVTMVLIRHILYSRDLRRGREREPAVLRRPSRGLGVERRQVAGSAK